MANRFLWIDLEMTGLDEKVHHIIEVAAIITDLKWEKLAEYHQIVHQPQEVMDQMDDWCKKTHGESGLTEAVKTGTPLAKVEEELLEVCKKHFSHSDRIVLAGNSVGNDRRFIDAYMPKLAKKLHYRIMDVSSYKEVFKDKYGIEYDKKNTHRALDDIVESINELKLYLSHVKAPEKS